MQEISTHELLICIKRNKRSPEAEAAIAELYIRYERKFMLRAKSKGVTIDDCKTLLQETFVRVFRSIHTYNEHKGISTNGEGWLSTIFNNVLADKFRRAEARHRTFSFDRFTPYEQEKMLRRSYTVQEADIPESIAPPDAAIHADRRDALQRAWSQLVPTDKAELQKGIGKRGGVRGSWRKAMIRWAELAGYPYIEPPEGDG